MDSRVDSPTLSPSTDSADEILDSDDNERETERRKLRNWVLWLPTVLALFVEALVTSGTLGVLVPSWAGTLVFGLYSLVFVVAVLGTLNLYDDAKYVARESDRWQPSPWTYIVGGAVVLVPLLLLPTDFGSMSLAMLPAVFGAFLVAALVSSIVSGPVYLVRRRIALGQGELSTRSQRDQDADQQ